MNDRIWKAGVRQTDKIFHIKQKKTPEGRAIKAQLHTSVPEHIHTADTTSG